MTTSQGAPAGWYPDPGDARQVRWYDGRQWTTHVQPAPQPALVATPQSYGAQYSAGGQYGAQYSAASAQYGAATFSATCCQQCGASPAMPVKLRGHHGMLFMQRFLTYRGTWCRDCGTSRFRAVQKDLLLKGWWGYISFFVTWANLVQNVLVLGHLRRQGTPQNRRAQPLPPGGSVFASAGFAVTVALIAVLGYLVVR